MEKTTGVYVLKSISTNKIYVGAAVNIHKRIRDHFLLLRKNEHYNPKIQDHYNEFGRQDIDIIILEVCDKTNLASREQYYIDSLKPYFNICLTVGNTAGLSHKMSDEAKKKLSSLRKGKPRGYAVLIHKGGDNVNAKKVIRIDKAGNEKLYPALSCVFEDGFTFQNVHRAIKRGHKHKGYIWKYQVDLTTIKRD